MRQGLGGPVMVTQHSAAVALGARGSREMLGTGGWGFRIAGGDVNSEAQIAHLCLCDLKASDLLLSQSVAIAHLLLIASLLILLLGVYCRFPY